MISRNMPLDELIKTLDQLSDMTKSPVFLESASQLSYTRTALTCLQDALFYVRMYQSTDSTGEGERRRQQLIDDSETIIGLIRTGGLYP